MLEFPIEFYDDEVRDGFYVPSIMKHNWAAQIEMVNVVDEICRRNNIKYYLFAGSLIGAVRHGGFIPWDDDMDICMLRKDYKRFLNALDREKPEKYWVRNYYKEKEYREVFTRLLDDEVVMVTPEYWGKRHGFICNAGIDIFPLDFIPTDNERREKLSHLIMHLQYIIKKYDEEGHTSELEGKLVTLEQKFKVSIKRDDTIPQQMYFIMDDLLDSVKRSESNNVHISLRWAQNECGEGIPIDSLKNTIDVRFEIAKFMAPYHYDETLKASFGNYMKSVRVCDIHHYPWYQEILEDFTGKLGLVDYPFKESLLPNKDRRNDWKQKKITELNSVIELFEKASSLVEKSFASGDTENGNKLLVKCNDLAIKAEKIEESLKEKDRERVVFLTWKSEYWKFYEPYYRKEVRDGNEVLVLPVPFARLTEIREWTEETCEEIGFPDDIELIDYKTFDFESARISRIYTQNIYDNQNEAVMFNSFFFTSNIREYTDELIYIPWFKLDEYGFDDIRAKFVSQYFMRMPGIVAVDKIILDNDQNWLKEHYIRELTEWAGESTSDIWEKKIQISELETENIYEKNNCKKKIMYYIGTGQILANPEKMIDKMRKNLGIFESSAEKLIVKLFIEQELADSIKKFAPKYVDIFNQVCSEYKEKKWCEYIETNEPIDINNKKMIENLICDTDAFYGDAGVLMHILLENRKPVMQQNVDC